jgi:hypothetical protein
MRNLMERKHTLVQDPNFDKGHLTHVHRPMGYRGKSNSIRLCNKLKDDIGRSNRSKELNTICPFHFGDESENPKVEPRDIDLPLGKIIVNMENQSLEQFLEFLKQDHRKAIWHKCRIRLHASQHHI